MSTVIPTIKRAKFYLLSIMNTEVKLFGYIIYSSADAHCVCQLSNKWHSQITGF